MPELARKAPGVGVEILSEHKAHADAAVAQDVHKAFAVAVFSEGLLDENEKLNKEIMGLMSMFYGYLQSIIAEGQNQHIFLPSISAGDLTMVVIATFKHYMFSWKFDKFNSDLLVSIHKMCAQLLTLMKNNPTQS